MRAKIRLRPAALAASESLPLRAAGFIACTAFIWLILATYRFVVYYQTLLTPSAQKLLFALALIYTVYLFGLFTWGSRRQIKRSKAVLTLIGLKKFIWGIGSFVRTGPRDYRYPLAKLSAEEKRALLFSAVKFFFIPLMVAFFFGNFDGFSQNIKDFSSNGGNLFSVSTFNNLVFPLLFDLFLLIDTAFFTFGYMVESAALDSSIRSVEPTILGWSVALICYPPFNGLLGNYVPWHANDYAIFSSQGTTAAVRVLLLLLMGFYASASVALGPKASNLTNRGIVGWGPYRVMRHPAYISKNLFWWITLLPAITITGAAGMAVWSSIYFMRAITEERHLSRDPDYMAYCKKTRYRFIPGLI